MLQIRADRLVGALSINGDPLEMLLDLRVVVDLTMVGRVGLPVEVVELVSVLVVVRHEGCLCAGGKRARDEHEQEEADAERRS